MNKSEIDIVITKNYSHIKEMTTYFIKRSKHEVDQDVITWAYEEVLKKPEQLNTRDDVVCRMLQNIKMATIWSNSGYHKKYSKKEVRMSDDLLSIFASQEQRKIEKNIVDDFLKVCDNHDKMLLNTIITGHDTSTKLSRFTGIPRNTCYKMIKKLKEKLIDFKNENTDKYNISNN